MNLLSLTLLVRESLLQDILAQDLLAPDDALSQRLYREAVRLVPPSSTAQRSASKYKNTSDGATLGAFLQGDASAFEALMLRHLPWMQAWARKHLPADDADDAAQEAFITLLKKAPSVHFEPHASLRGYLFGLLRISVLRSLRSQARRRNEPLEDELLDMPDDTTPSPEDALFSQYSVGEISKALESSCNLREQEVILLTSQGEDDTYIAAALETSVQNVRTMRHRARSKLRDALASSAS